MQINIINQDITTLEAEAIVNAANRHLSQGGGVCGAIHQKAGPELEKECLRLSRPMGGLLPGEAVITKGHELPAKHVIHTLGPVWREQNPEQHDQLKEELADCYRNSLAIAEKHQLRSVAFPSIGTGAFGWDKSVAAQIALTALIEHKPQHVEQVMLCCYGEAEEEMYLMRSILRVKNLLKVKTSRKTPNLGEIAQIMNGRPDDQKIRVLRNTLMKFLMYVQHNGYTFDEPDRSLFDFFNDHKNGPEAATNLIKTVWVVLNAETIVDAEAKRN